MANSSLTSLISAVQVAIATQRAMNALDAASVKILAFDEYVRLSDAAFVARKDLAHQLDQQPADMALTGCDSQGKQLLFTPSAKESGCWQLTRFDRQGEPWGDTHYTNRLHGLKEYLQEVNLKSLCSQDGPLGDSALTANAKAALLVGTHVTGADGTPLTVYHGTQGVFTDFSANPRGIFFAEDRAAAEPFSRIRSGQPVIKAAHLAINRPWTMVRYSMDTPYNVQVDQSIATLKAKGYDGIYCPHDKVWIAFEPYQVFDAAQRTLPNVPNDMADHKTVENSHHQDTVQEFEQNDVHDDVHDDVQVFEPDAPHG